MKITKTGYWMIGGAALATLGIGTFILIAHRKNKSQKGKTKTTSSSIGTGIQIKTGTTGTIKQEPNWHNPFDMNYRNDVSDWLAPKSILTLNEKTADNYAKDLKNAKGRFNDNEAIVKAIFGKRLQDKTQVASLSEAFFKRYKKDLWQYLNSFLSQSELESHVKTPVKRLPNYQLL